MNETESEGVTILIELLENMDSKQISLKDLENRLQRILKDNTESKADANDVIQYALDNWIVDKILDYDDSSEESMGEPVWFIRILTEEEAEVLQNLPEAAKCFIKILYESKTDGTLGVVRTRDVLKTLRERRYNLELVPYVSNKISDFFKTKGGKLVQFHYLVPEDEKSEEYKAGLRELDEKTRRRLIRKER